MGPTIMARPMAMPEEGGREGRREGGSGVEGVR